MTDIPAKKPLWRRLLPRLSVRALMILVLVIGGGAGWIVHRARVQREAVAAIKAAGGFVDYEWDWEFQRDLRSPGGKPAPPKWLVDAIGVDYLGSVVYARIGAISTNTDAKTVMAHVGRLTSLRELNLNNAQSVTDHELVILGGLTELRRLDLTFTGATGASLKYVSGLKNLLELHAPYGRTTDDDLAYLKELTQLDSLQFHPSRGEFTNAGLAHLRGLVNLKILGIASPKITTAGLAALRDMSRLERLGLGNTSVDNLSPIQHLTGLRGLGVGPRMTDAGLAPVSKMSMLESLILQENPIEDAGLAHIVGLTNLTHVNLDKTRITSAGLAHLTGLTKLQNLWLNDTAVDDVGLHHLAGLDQLSLLFLRNTQVTDKGMLQLEGLKNCQQVAIDGTKVTDAGIAAASKRRPQTKFVRMLR